jgi:hypothetical protein
VFFCCKGHCSFVVLQDWKRPPKSRKQEALFRYGNRTNRNRRLACFGGQGAVAIIIPFIRRRREANNSLVAPSQRHRIESVLIPIVTEMERSTAFRGHGLHETRKLDQQRTRRHGHQRRTEIGLADLHKSCSICIRSDLFQISANPVKHKVIR